VELYPPRGGRGGNDSGGVHLYSGIPNRAFFLVATTLGGYSWEKAGKIWYDTLNDDGLKNLNNDPKFNRTAFKVFADLTVKHAEKFGPDAVKAVKDAWTDVKVYPWKTNWSTRP
jgi:Zn-dependent metalloprotease